MLSLAGAVSPALIGSLSADCTELTRCLGALSLFGRTSCGASSLSPSSSSSDESVLKSITLFDDGVAKRGQDLRRRCFS